MSIGSVKLSLVLVGCTRGILVSVPLTAVSYLNGSGGSGSMGIDDHSLSLSLLSIALGNVRSTLNILHFFLSY